MKLKNRVAVITGTSPNIGGGIAEGLAAEGAIVVAVDANAANAQDCAAYLEKTGGRALGLACDVTDEAKVKATIDAALASVRQDRRAGEQCGLLQQEGRHRHDVRGMEPPDRRDPGGRLPVHQVRLPRR